MAVVGFLLYAFLGYSVVSVVSDGRDKAYDTFVLRYVNGTVIGETFINDSLVCGWALGLLKYVSKNEFLSFNGGTQTILFARTVR